MKQQESLLRHNEHMQNRPLTGKRKQGLLTGLLAGIPSGFYTNSLETGADKTTLQSMLLGSLQLRDKSSINEMLDFLRDEGDRTSYAILLPYLSASANRKELEKTIRERFFGIELFIRRTHNLHRFLTLIQHENDPCIGKEELDRGVLAWDMGRLVNLSRIAYETGNISRNESWRYIEWAGDQCRSAFDNWEKVGKSYLLGQVMETEEEAKTTQAIAYFKLATQSQESPWNG